jgi:hypothetical protein
MKEKIADFLYIRLRLVMKCEFDRKNVPRTLFYVRVRNRLFTVFVIPNFKYKRFIFIPK